MLNSLINRSNCFEIFQKYFLEPCYKLFLPQLEKKFYTISKPLNRNYANVEVSLHYRVHFLEIVQKIVF